MGRRFLALALSVCACALVSAEEPVHFGDAALKAAVEETLWIVDPTPSDMLGLTAVEARGKGVMNLVGLEYARNLMSLGLGDNLYIQDISPLAGLTHLTSVVLNQNRIDDISPLAGLVRLTDLDLHHNQIRDISALAGLTKMRRLALRENLIRDISALAGMVRMETLVLSCTEVSDLAPLVGMRSLRTLDLRECPLDRSAHERYIPQIIANNPGVEIRYDPLPWYSVAISSSAGGAVTRPGEGTFSFEKGQILLLTAAPDPGYAFLYWYGTFNGTENPASLAVVENHDIQANFVSLSSTLFVDAASASGAKPGEAGASSPQEDGTPERPFDTIQEAIDAADDGTTIYVRPGAYREHLDLLGKDVRLMGTNPDEPNGAPFPVIEGTSAGPIVSFTRGEGPDCVLVGFVLTRGAGSPASAVYCNGGSPIIANCLIVGNRASYFGGAVVSCRNSRAAFVNCTIADNATSQHGAAIYLADSDVVVTNSILRGNGPNQILTAGTSRPAVTYSNIEGGWSGFGMMNAAPLFAQPGGWANPDNPGVAVDPGDADAVWIDGDYHLKSRAGRRSTDPPAWHMDSVTSPCVDGGDPASPLGAEPSPNGGLINLGAYGGTIQASRSTAAPPIWGSIATTPR